MSILQKSFILVLLIMTGLLFILPAKAALELEYKYPKLPGIEKTFTATSTLSQTIQYWIGFALLVSGIVVLISIIWAGLQYITSQGQPQAMASAKSRLLNAFLGLAIILGSYIILNTLNPQLIVMKIKKIPVQSGVLLLSQEGWNDLNDPEKNLTVQDLVEGPAPKAYFLQNSIGDLRQELGPLVVTELLESENNQPGGSGETSEQPKPKVKVNYKNIPFDYLAIMPDLGKGLRVNLYKDLNCKGEVLRVYDYEGEIDLKTQEIIKNSFPDFNSIHIFETPTFVSPFPSNTKEPKKGEELTPFKPYYEEHIFKIPAEHPPLCVLVENVSAGVYLYGENKTLENRFFGFQSYENFKNPDIDFNDKAESILIRNQDPKTEQSFDLIAVLFEDPYFNGELRIFFEQKERLIDVSQQTKENVGNVEREKILDLDDNSHKYGRIKPKKASSIWIENLADLEKEPDACQEVKLCTDISEAGGTGYCLIFTPNEDEEITKEELLEGIWVARKKMPFFKPISLNEDLVIKKLNKDGKIEGENRKKTFNFNDQIRTIEITPEGGCLVVLFQNDVANGNKNPGGNSEVFVNTDNDLRDNKINKCGPPTLFGRDVNDKTVGEPCASAIVVFPIK